LIILTISLFAGSAVIAESDGISGQIVDNGCVCHGGGGTNQDISVSLTGLPEGDFEPGEIYNLSLTISGGPDSDGQNQGGFNLKASAGELTSIDGSTQIEDGQLTHTSSGNDQRNWTFQWVAPQSGAVTFSFHGNSVDGDGSPNSEDLWNSNSLTISGPDGEQSNVGFRTDTGEPHNSLPYILSAFIVLILIVVISRRSDSL
jgi:hypothetical protein|tara:strand:- start:2251 stop:2856 length:606 start_codon:yes stop_codon:yes gene_type:complete